MILVCTCNFTVWMQATQTASVNWYIANTCLIWHHAYHFGMLLSTEVYSSADLKEITGWGQEKKGLQFHLLFFMVLGQRYLHSTLCISGELECILQNFKTRQICTKNAHWLANTGVLEGHSVLMELVMLKDQENWRRERKPCWMPLASLTVKVFLGGGTGWKFGGSDSSI